MAERPDVVDLQSERAKRRRPSLRLVVARPPQKPLAFDDLHADPDRDTEPPQAA